MAAADRPADSGGQVGAATAATAVPLASVIVPAFNAAPTLGLCLSALLDQRELDGPLEIIVVDDGSTDGSAPLAQALAPRVRLLRQAHRGAGAARNRGAAAARGAILLFTDADCRPAPDWAARMLEPFADPAVAGAKGFFTSDQSALLARVVQAEYEEKDARLLRQSRLAFADTASAAYRAAVFRAAGGFRPELGAVEDTELAFRLAAAGHRLAPAPRARVAHRHPERLRDYVRRKLRYGRWGAGAYLSHPARMADDSRTPWSMRLQLLLAPMLLAALALLPWYSAAGWTAALTALAFLLSNLPYVGPTWRRHGPAVALAGPPVFLLRALALDAGLALGLAARLRGGAGRPAAAGDAADTDASDTGAPAVDAPDLERRP